MSMPGFTARSALDGTYAAYEAVAATAGGTGRVITPSAEYVNLCCGRWPRRRNCDHIRCPGRRAFCHCNGSTVRCYCV